MSRRRIIRVALALVVFLILVAVAAVCLIDTAMRHLMVRRLEAATGMKATIGAVHVGLGSGAVTVRDFRLYNPPAFGTNVCLDMPELHVECDAAGLAAGQLHLKLVRVDLARLVLVQDKNGHSNFGALEHKPGTASPTHELSARGLKFSGIDTLDLSLGTLQTQDLANGRATEIPFGIRHQIMHNVKSEADVAALGLILALRSGSSRSNGIDLANVLKALNFP